MTVIQLNAMVSLIFWVNTVSAGLRFLRLHHKDDVYRMFLFVALAILFVGFTGFYIHLSQEFPHMIHPLIPIVGEWLLFSLSGRGDDYFRETGNAVCAPNTTFLRSSTKRYHTSRDVLCRSARIDTSTR